MTNARVSDFVRADSRPLVIAAHVDDDGVGFGMGIRDRAQTTIVVYLTDSAPREARYFNAPAASRAEYAAMRRREAERVAMKLGLGRGALHFLDAVDMESYRELPRLERELIDIVARGDFDAVWSSAYDGGHPDHDVAAFLASRLATRFELPHFEFALYRYRQGIDPFRFAAGDDGVERRLHGTDAAFKRELVALYESQASMLSRFDLRCERYRRAPAYDFGRRPVAGPTLYESWNWPITAEMLIDAFARFAGTV